MAAATGVPVGVLGLGASTLESMIPPAGYQAYEEPLGELANGPARRRVGLLPDGRAPVCDL